MSAATSDQRRDLVTKAAAPDLPATVTSSGNNLHYQLVLQTSADDDDDIVVTDTLPENVGFKVDNVKIALDEGDFVKISDKNVDWATAEYDKTTRKLTIKISNYNKSERRNTASASSTK